VIDRLNDLGAGSLPVESDEPEQPLDEEGRLRADPRLNIAVRLFNTAEWYGCHDGFEELWHETQGPMRSVLQGILQIAVAELHLERGNCHGATVLMGEGLGRLRASGDEALGLDLVLLRQGAAHRFQALQAQRDTDLLPLPRLELA
jgi:predicted metal-dependent hydrolase